MLEQKSKNKKTIRTFIHSNKVYFIVLIMVMLVVGACAVLIRSFQTELYNQRSYSLAQTTEKIVQITDNVVDNEWERLTFISHELSQQSLETIAELQNKLEDYYNIDSQKHKLKISCIDTNGTTYQWNGKTGRWQLPAMLLSDKPAFQVTIIDNFENGLDQMAFLYTLPERITLPSNNVVLTHTLLFLDMEAFDADFAVSSYNTNSFSYITEQNGVTIYHQQNQNQFLSSYNILSTLKDTKFLYDGSYEKLVESIHEGENYIGEIEYEGENYFVSCSPLSINTWSLFIFVPESSIGENTANVIGIMLLQISMIAILIIVMISLFVWTNTRHTIAKQKLAVDEAHKASEAKSNFLSHMSHDIRTPLNGIIGMCHIAKQKSDNEEAILDCLDKIDLSSRQLMALINDVLDMSRIEQGKIDIHQIPIDIISLLKTCSIHTEVMINEKEITCTQDTSGIIHSIVSADAVIIEKILVNILGNAAKFTNPGGKIELIASETVIDSAYGIYHFEVKDNGVGMSEEFAKHLFEPFSQEKIGSRTKYQGTGLGLAIVKNLVDKIGGSIQVESAINVGSTFIVDIPLKYSDQEAYLTEAKVTKPFDGTGLKALLVEDNELNSMIAKLILEECGFTVETAVNGAIAVEQFKNSQLGTYAIILMDIRMPVMNGLEASRCIRSLNREDAIDVPIIALSADAFEEDMQKTQQAGMDAHLSKPIDITKLHVLLTKFCSKDKEI